MQINIIGVGLAGDPMTVPELLSIAVALAMDAFAVSVAAGAAGSAPGRRATFRLAFHFGLFQFLMPVIGWLAGSTFADHVAAFDHWIAFALLGCIGVQMIRAGLDPDPDRRAGNPSKGWALIALSLATSIDALAVGLSLAMLQVRIWQVSVVIGLTAALFSVLGHRGGGRLGGRIGKRAELFGGALLVGIGLKILVEHLA
jgi:putative Mn2+ efflux pump MntP